MKILSVHVTAFGKLRNVDLQLRPGMNVFSNVNGYGKTTMASFIRAMLYGFTYTRSKGATDAARAMPWGSTDRFGGHMTVEQNGKLYKIERFFGNTARQESLTVTDARTNKRVEWGMQPGEYLLGLTADSYDRSAYFPQESVELCGNDNFDNRLANLVQNGAEDYDKIQDKLRSYKKSFCYEKGNGGLIYRLEQQEYALQGELRKAQSDEQRSVEIAHRLSAINAERLQLQSRHREATARREQLINRRAQMSATEQDKRVGERLAQLNETLSRTPPEFERDIAACSDLSDRIAAAQPEPRKKRKSSKRSKGLIAAAAVLLALGVLLLALGIVKVLPLRDGLIFGLVTSAIGLAGLVILCRGAGRPKVDPERDKLTADFFALAGKYVATDSGDIEQVKRDLWNLYKKYGEDKRERDSLASMVVPAADTSHADSEIEAVTRTLDDLTRELRALDVEEGGLNAERKRLSFDCVGVQDRILQVRSDKQEAQYRYHVADTVSKLLASAKDELSSGYLPRLCAKCTQLLRDVTGAPLSVDIDRNFAVRICENGLSRAMADYSRGTREITLLCFRVALSELLYNGAIPFVIIDDAFVNFDENNFLRATELLRQLSAHSQIIYFTCHSRTGNLLK